MSELFYLQDSRSFCGNDVFWWAHNNAGYTTDLRKAKVFTKDEAQRQHNCRETDIPWPKEYIDARTRPAVDMQYIDRKEALAGTGIELRKPDKPKKKSCRCHGCGRFMEERDMYRDCSNCGAYNGH